MPPSNRKRDHQLIENQQHLAQWVRNARGPLDLAVAFWGKGAVEELKLEEVRPIRVLLELQSGGTNPAEVRRLMDLAHVEVRQLTRLHAKAYIANDAVVIGSTNASANGLGSEGSESTRWHELAMRTNDGAVVRDTQQWFEEKWAESRPITPSELKTTELEWKKRQRFRPRASTDAKDILTAALGNPDDYRNRGIFVVVTLWDWDAKGYADAKDHEQRTGQEAVGWQDWSAIPKDATLICFSDYKGQGFEWDEPNIVYSPPRLNRHKSLVLVSAMTLDYGLRPGNIRQWAKALMAVKATIPAKRWHAAGGMCMDLGAFAEKVIAQRSKA